MTASYAGGKENSISSSLILSSFFKKEVDIGKQLVKRLAIWGFDSIWFKKVAASLVLFMKIGTLVLQFLNTVEVN